MRRGEWAFLIGTVVLLLFWVWLCTSVQAAREDIWAVSSSPGNDVWRITSSGHLLPGKDKTYDLGASGTAVRDVYVGGLSSLNGGLKVVRRNISSFPATSQASDIILGLSGTGARTLNLVAAATAGAGAILIVKDEAGNAATNNITIDPNGAETVDGAATLVMNVNFQTVRLYCNGSNWFTW